MNLLSDLPTSLSAELVEVILDSRSVRIERIVSAGQNSPDGFWYDQEESEWVVVLKGQAELRFEDDRVRLNPGDYVYIPAHRKHRVEHTSDQEPTVWLAVFFHETE